MRKIVGIVVTLLVFALMPAVVTAQGGGTITGRVIDQATQQPVQGAEISIAGTRRAVQTDRDGRYAITGVAPGSYDVRVRRVGYGSTVQHVNVTDGASASAEFALTTAATRLEEVVVNAVTGQAQRRAEIGTNTGNISVGELDKGPIKNMADVLQARVAGVTVGSTGGGTGAGQRIRIRGANSLSLSNEPLLYLDGVLMSNGKGGISAGGGDYSRLNDLNPDEIEGIEILKGPAASAIYGSAAANGVLLITTKKGRAGAPVWRPYFETGQLTDKIKYPLNFATLQRNASGVGDTAFYEASNQILNTTQVFGPGAPFTSCANFQAAAGTCTQDVFLSFDQFRDPRTTPFVNGTHNKVGASVSGGSEALTYFLSGDRTDENGVLRPNNLNQISLRSNINAKIGSNATAAVTAAYVSSSHHRPGEANNIFSPLINGFLGPAQYLTGMETDTAAVPGARPGSFFGFNSLDDKFYVVDQFLDRFIVGANTNYTPMSWLRLNGNAGLDYYGRNDQQSLDPNLLPIGGEFDVGFRDAFRGSNYEWTSNASAAATFSPLSSLQSTTTLGGSFQRELFHQIECFGQAIPAGTTSCSAATTQFAVSEVQTELRTVGGFLRQEFALNDRLFLSGSVRADNNSGLSRDVTGLSVYPSVNASWLISDESFFPKLSFMNQLRFRAGYGQAGQRPGFGQAQSFFGSRSIQRAGAELPALILSATGNPGLKVERTTEKEGGFDFGLFKNRVSAEFTGFTRSSKDALVARNLPPSSGLGSPGSGDGAAVSVFQNLGSIRNWGTETGLNVNVLDMEKVNFNVRLTAATLHNRIDKLGEGIAPISINRGEQQHREGFSAGGFFALPIKFNDKNGDGKLSPAEVSIDTSKFLILPNAKGGLDTLRLAYVGPQLPTSTRGLSFDLTLMKNVTITTLFEHRGGNRQLNETEYFRCRTTNSAQVYGFCGAIADPKASLAAQAAFIGASQAGFGATPYGYIEDASFTKWRELSVRFTMPDAIGGRVSQLNGASLTLSGRNLHTWTKYTGLDPEINEGGGNNFTQSEFNTQPPTRTFVLRLDLKL